MKEIEDSIIALNESVPDKTFLYSLRHLTKALEKIRKQEIERYVKKLSIAERELAEDFTTEYINRIINTTILQLKASSGKSDLKRMSRALNELFNPESPLITKYHIKNI